MTHDRVPPETAPASPDAGPRIDRQTALWFRFEGAVVLLLSLLIYNGLGMSWWLFVGLLLAPDLFMLGYLSGPRIGALVYNIGHTYTTPLLVMAFGFITGITGLMPVVIIWIAHIGMDRMFGYGMKLPGGFKQTHLG